MGYTGTAALECQIVGDPNELLPRCVEYLRQVDAGVKEHAHD
jgi:hypothetical protein